MAESDEEAAGILPCDHCAQEMLAALLRHDDKTAAATLATLAANWMGHRIGPKGDPARFAEWFRSELVRTYPYVRQHIEASRAIGEPAGRA